MWRSSPSLQPTLDRQPVPLVPRYQFASHRLCGGSVLSCAPRNTRIVSAAPIRGNSRRSVWGGRKLGGRRQPSAHTRVKPPVLDLIGLVCVRHGLTAGRKWDSNSWSLSRGCRLVLRGRAGRRPSALRLGLIVSAKTAAIARVTLAAIASANPGKIDDIFRL